MVGPAVRDDHPEARARAEETRGSAGDDSWARGRTVRAEHAVASQDRPKQEQAQQQRRDARRGGHLNDSSWLTTPEREALQDEQCAGDLDHSCKPAANHTPAQGAVRTPVIDALLPDQSG